MERSLSTDEVVASLFDRETPTPQTSLQAGGDGPSPPKTERECAIERLQAKGIDLGHLAPAKRQNTHCLTHSDDRPDGTSPSGANGDSGDPAPTGAVVRSPLPEEDTSGDTAGEPGFPEHLLASDDEFPLPALTEAGRRRSLRGNATHVKQKSTTNLFWALAPEPSGAVFCGFVYLC